MFSMIKAIDLVWTIVNDTAIYVVAVMIHYHIQIFVCNEVNIISLIAMFALYNLEFSETL